MTQGLRGEVAEMRSKVSTLASAAPHRGGLLTPAQSFRQRAQLPDDPSALAESLMVAMMEQDMGTLMRATLSLSAMRPNEIEDLMIQIRDSAADNRSKDAALRMLVSFLDPEDNNTGLVLDKVIEFKITAGLLSEKMARWAEHNPAAATAWFQKSKTAGKFERIYGQNDVADRYLGILLPAMARTTPEGASRLLGEFDDSWKRDRAIERLTKLTLERGEPGAIELVTKMLLETKSQPARKTGFLVALSGPMPNLSLDDLMALARSLDFEPGFESWGAPKIAMARGDLPYVERANWLVAQIGEHDPSQIRDLVTRARVMEPPFSSWVIAQPPGPILEHALRGEIEALSKTLKLGGEAIARARMIADDDMRSKALRVTLQRLPDAAEQAAPPANEQEARELERALEESGAKKENR